MTDRDAAPAAAEGARFRLKRAVLECGKDGRPFVSPYDLALLLGIDPETVAGGAARPAPAAAPRADDEADNLEKSYREWASSPHGYGRFKDGNDPRIPFEHGWRSALGHAAAPREGAFFTQRQLDDLLRRTFEDGRAAAREAARGDGEG